MRRSEVVCLGEALVLLPDLTGGSQAGSLAGAEVNVAVGLAGAGVPTAWVGRLGDDPFGAFLHAELVRRRVDVGGVEIDRDRPTGCYAKQPGVDRHGEPATRMHYRRAGSAASAMGPAFLDRPAVRERLAGAAVVHCSGITAALSASCADLMRALLARPRGPLVCFDVNWREQMWPSGDAGLVAELAGRADVVLVGADEARRVFGTDDAAELRRQLPGPRLLVIKDGARRGRARDRARAGGGPPPGGRAGTGRRRRRLRGRPARGHGARRARRALVAARAPGRGCRAHHHRRLGGPDRRRGPRPSRGHGTGPARPRLVDDPVQCLGRPMSEPASESSVQRMGSVSTERSEGAR